MLSACASCRGIVYTRIASTPNQAQRVRSLGTFYNLRVEMEGWKVADLRAMDPREKLRVPLKSSKGGVRRPFLRITEG